MFNPPPPKLPISRRVSFAQFDSGSLGRRLIALVLIYALLLQCMPLVDRLAYAHTSPRPSETSRNSGLTNPAPKTNATTTLSPLLTPPPPTAETITDAVISRHKPTLTNGLVEGSLRVLLGESFTINNATSITSDVFVPGAPNIQVNQGAEHGGVVEDGGANTPNNYTLTLANNANLPGRIHTRADAIVLPQVATSVPPAAGNRSVTVNSQSQVASIGDWQTVRDLNIHGSHITVDLPPGNYGTLTINGNSQANLSAGTYNFANTFNLDGSAKLQATGAVVINVGRDLTINSGALTLGSYTAPADVRLNVLGSQLNIKGSSQVSALVSAYNGHAKLSGTSRVRGRVIADNVTLNGGKVLGAIWPVLSGTAMTIFGPRRFDRTSGSPNQYVEQFSLPAGTTAPFTLHIQNGSLDGTDRVDSATIKVNGVSILTPSDLNENVASLDRTITLSAQNQLDVSLASDPGSYLIINITGTVPANDTTAPLLEVTNPLNDSTVTNSQITVTGTASDPGQGASGVAHVYVNDVEAAYNSSNNTWALTGVSLSLGPNQLVVRAVDQAGYQTTVTVKVKREAPENHSPTVDAGGEQIITLPSSALLDGNATDDGLPEGSSLTTTWSKVSGPGDVTFGDPHALSTSASFSTHGTYVLSLSATDGQLTESAEVTITVEPQNQPPTVSAGADQTIALPSTATLNGTVTDDGLPASNVVTTLWGKVSGPGTVTFEDPTLTDTVATFSEAGDYRLRLAASDGELTTQAEVQITVHPQNQAPTVDAGAEQTIYLPADAQLNGTVSDDGWPYGSTLTTTWAKVSGPGTVTFANPNVTVTTASFSVAGNYLLSLTATDGDLSTSKELTIHVMPPNQAPVVSAGEDQYTSLPDAVVTLNGSVTDDGLPVPSTLVVLWTKVAGPGDVIFGNPNQANTTAQFTVAGDYTLRLTASDGELSNFSNVLVHVTPPNQAPDVSAGTTQTVVLPASASLNGTVSDDQLPLNSTVSTVWSKVSGPGTVTFANPNVTVTTASFSVAGTYVLRLTATDSALTDYADVTVIVEPVNQAPAVNAGADQTITLPASAVLHGTVTDDGYPSGSSVSVAWSKVSGPGTVTFSDPTSVDTNAIFSVAGTYVLRLTATDSQLTTPGELQVIVIPQNFAPTVNAGGDQTVSLPASASLNGTVSDDGLPAGSTLTTLWTKVSGPGDVTFANASVTVTTASFSAPGTYVLRLTANDTDLTNNDELTIVVTDPRIPPVANFTAPQSFGVAGGFVFASSGGTTPDSMLDSNNATSWTTAGQTNQFAKIQFYDQQGLYVDRVRLQGHQGGVGISNVKDFEVQVSATTSDDASFVTVLTATYINNGQLQEFAFPAGALRVRFIKFLPKNNHAGSGTITIGTFNPIAVGSVESAISLPGNANGARSQSPALFMNGAAIHSFSYTGGNNSANGLLGYFGGGWSTSKTANRFAIVQLGGSAPVTIKGVKLATSFDSGFGSATAVKDFQIWVSSTTADDAAFTQVLTTTAPFVGSVQTHLFPGGPVQARYVKYVPLNTHGTGTTIFTPIFDVVLASGARVVGVSGESQNAPNPAEAAFDNEPNSNWSSPNGVVTNVWVKTSLTDEVVQKLYGVRISPNSTISLQQGPKDFDIRVSTTTTDDSAFTTVFSGTVATSVGAPQEFLFPNAVDAKYVQFFWKNGYNASTISVRELEALIYPPRGSALLAFSTQDELASNGLDLDPTNQVWSTANTFVTNQWLKLVMPRGDLANINHIALRPAIAGNGFYGPPKDFDLQVSTTDANDASFVTVLSGTFANNTQLQDFYFAPTQARFVRLLLKNSYHSSRMGVAGFYVYAADEIGTTARFFDQSTDADGPIVSWAWEFGDGTTSSQRNPAHTYAQPGNYTVSLTVTDHTGLTHMRQTLYHVTEALRAEYTASPIFAHEGGENVRFTDFTKLLANSVAFRQYDFGDGSQLSQAATSSIHTFAENGTYHTTFKLGDPQGTNFTATRDVVVVNVAPTVDIPNGSTVVWGQSWTSVPTITDQSVTDRLTLQGLWDFGDGQTSTCVNCTNANATVTHAYSTPGTYVASLTITDRDGGSGSDTATYVVNKRATTLTFLENSLQGPGQFRSRAKLNDTFANAGVANRTIQFNINGNTGTATTDATGVAEVTLPIAANAITATITASFTSDSLYLGSTNNASVTLNFAPTVNAGADQATTFPCGVTLTGTATDDGVPSGASLTYAWTKVSGPGNVTFSNSTALTTSASFSTSGKYVLRLTANDSQITASDDVFVTVNAVEVGPSMYLGPTPYLSFADSPISGRNATYFHLEDFEDHLLNVPGVTASAGGVSSIAFGPSLHDSVDADDGVINGSGTAGDAYFTPTGAAGITFTFNATTLGNLPTHAGLVWTDGAGTTFFEAFDRNGVSMGARGPFNIADGSNNGTTSEDNFFGVYNKDGISAIKIWNTVGGMEIDHLQYSFATANTPPVINAGPDQTLALESGSAALNGAVSDDGLPSCVTVTSTWSKVSGPGTVTFANAQSPITTATMSAAGIYVLRLTATDVQYTTSDDVVIRVTNNGNLPPTADAGPDQTVSLPSKNVGLFVNDLTGFNTAAGTPPVVVDFDNIAAGTDITATTIAGMRFDLGNQSPSAPLIVTAAADTFTPSGFTGVINASTNKLIATSGANVLSPGGPQLVPGSNPLVENDDLKITFAQPVSAVGFDLLFQSLDFFSAVGVTILDANGAVIYSNTNLPVGTGAGGGAPGGTVFFGFVSTRANIATIVIDESDGNADFPDSNIGFDSFRVRGLIAANAIVNLSGSALDDGQPPGGSLSYAWSKVSGPGSVSFDNSQQAVTAASFSEVGSYTLRLTANDSQLNGSDDVVITVNQGTVNHPPTVNAGADQNITLPTNTVNLNATVTDDGIPAGSTVSVTWSVLGGPGNVTFVNSHAATTTATFSAAGTYVLRLLASDSLLTGSDELVVIVNPEVVNQPPTANAGADQSTTINGNLVANPGNELALVNNEIPNWTEVQGTTWTRANESTGAGFPEPQRGQAYFFAGDTDQAELRQDIDVSAFAGTIAAGTQQFEFQVYLRSLAETAPDVGRVILEYRNAANTSMIASLDSGLISTTTGWHLTEDTRVAPLGTGWVRIRLIATRNTGTTNDVFFDSVSLRPVGNAAVKLVGVATDDGLPTGSTLSATWAAVSGPGSILFANANSGTTGASFNTPGTYLLRLTISDGVLTASDDVSVVVNPQNQPPVVNAGANQTITLPSSVSLNGSVTDDGQPAGSSVSVKWTRLSGPGTVTFADANATVTTATFSTQGVYQLRLTADDTEYAASSDLIITVNAQPGVNQPPVVNPGPSQTISLPTDTVTLHGSVTDDGLPTGSTLVITWSKVGGPGDVTFGNANSVVTTAQFSAIGNYVLRLSASDGAYLVSADVGVTLTPENHAPTANAGADQSVLLSQPAQLNGTVSDDGLPTGNLTTTWSKVSGPGTVTFDNANVTVTGATFGAIGVYLLRLTASDGALSASDEVTITVLDNVPVPTVEITLPDGSELTEPTPVTGSVSNGSWVVEYSLNSQDGNANQIWTQFGSGTGQVTNGLLGTLDTTLMLNGIYSVRLRSTDEYGQVSFISTSVLVDKGFKVGNFQLAFSDLNVPVAGLPIEVIRSYDSRDKRVGDFGVGWQLSLRNARLEKTAVLGLSWHQTVSSGIIPTYCLEPSRPHKVAVTFGNGQTYKFLASTSIHCQQFVPVTSAQMTFTPEPGTHASLEVVGPNDILVETLGSIPGPVRLLNQSNPDIFNSFTFRLTTAEGVSYVINQQTGVSSLSDRYGNTLTINANGVVHSSGKSIAFERDAQGRIKKIIDPNGNPQTYNYDANGDLVTFTDRETNPTTFTYDPGHYLKALVDARGVNLLTNQYDASGRLIGQTDADNKPLTYDHDIANRVETVTDRLGRQTRFEYDERGNVLKIVDARNGVKKFTYDELDNMLTETNELDKTTIYTYDAADNRETVEDPLHNITRYTYNSSRQVLTIRDARNKLTVNEYDPAGMNLVKTTDPLLHETIYGYSVFTGQRTTMKDALNHETRYDYDGAGRLASERDHLGNITTYDYDENGNRISQTVKRTNALGQIETISTVYTYDKLGQLIKTTFADSSFTRIEYNAIGQTRATIDQLNRRTEYTYDDMGRLTRTDYPDGTHEEATYDAEGRRHTSKDRAGNETTYEYDELGRPTKTIFADSTFTSIEYDAAGRIKNTRDARGNFTHYEYDEANRPTLIRNALSQETRFTYDQNGNQQTVKDALLRITTFEYDDNNQLTKTTYHDGSFDSATYDAVGRAETKTDQAGKTTWFFYDALGRLEKVKNALLQETTYTYNELGQQLTQKDANNHITRFEYDQLGRRVKRTLPGGQFETYAYDLGGNLESRTDFNGKTTSFTYDAMRRLRTKVPDPSLNQPTVTFTYNANGQRATMNDASGSTVYSYDIRNRLESKQTPFGTLTYIYDDAGNVGTVRSSNTNGVSVDYTYDELNRLKTVKDNRLLALNGGVTTYNYDAVGNLDNYQYPNAVKTTYNYNSLNRLTSMNTAVSATTQSSYTYTLGPAGNRTAVSELGGRTVNYTYDDLYRLKTENIANDPHGINGLVSYDYDPVGNRLTRSSTVTGVSPQSSTYDANDRLNSDTFDANGNTTASNSNSYSYDFENHLTSLNNGAVTYVYDGDGNRVAKTVGGVTTNYLVDTNNHTGYAQVVEELQTGSVTKQFTFGHDLISQRIIGGPLSFYSYDGHGSVRQLTDATASITDTYTYDAFGILIDRTGTTPNDYLYAGEQFDAHLGLYYLRARYLNQDSGRFFTLDSAAGTQFDPVSLHKYLYAAADPANLIDPSGNSFIDQAVSFAVNNILQTMAVSIPLRALQLVRDLKNGADLGTALWDAGIGLVTDAAIGLVLGGVLSKISRIIPIRNVSIEAFRNSRLVNSVWKLGWAARGRAIEEAILGRLPSLRSIANFPVIDDFVNGVATSIKSLDLTAATYQNGAALTRKLTEYATKLSQFQGARWGGVAIENAEIQGRVLLVALERGAASSEQAAVLKAFQKTAAQQWPNIKVMLQFIP